MFSRINIANTSLEIITYRTDDMTAVDGFAMVKADGEGDMVYETALLIALCAVLAMISAFIIIRFRRGRH